MMEAITKAQALELCEQVRKENRGKVFTYQWWWCWGCATFTNGDVEKRCFNGAPNFRGCGQMNQRIDEQAKA